MLQGGYNRLSFTQKSDFYGHKQFAERALFAGLPKAECFKHFSTDITVIVQGRSQLQLQTERFATKHASHDYFDDQSDVMIRLSHCVREMFTCVNHVVARHHSDSSCTKLLQHGSGKHVIRSEGDVSHRHAWLC